MSRRWAREVMGCLQKSALSATSKNERWIAGLTVDSVFVVRGVFGFCRGHPSVVGVFPLGGVVLVWVMPETVDLGRCLCIERYVIIITVCSILSDAR